MMKHKGRKRRNIKEKDRIERRARRILKKWIKETNSILNGQSCPRPKQRYGKSRPKTGTVPGNLSVLKILNLLKP